jgi:hypothetical protein
MKCERCLADKARFRVHTDAINTPVCASCAWRALELEIAVEPLLPGLRTDRQHGATFLSRSITSRNLYSHSAELNPSRESSVIDEQINCSWCGGKEILKKQKVLGRRQGSSAYIIHHECKSGHRFHNFYSTDPSYPLRLLLCNCSTEASVPIITSSLPHL